MSFLLLCIKAISISGMKINNCIQAEIIFLFTKQLYWTKFLFKQGQNKNSLPHIFAQEEKDQEWWKGTV